MNTVTWKFTPIRYTIVQRAGIDITFKLVYVNIDPSKPITIQKYDACRPV